jgi:GTP1/Obg family GTP-binding protein
MLFSEGLSIFYYIGLIATISTAVFTWRFYLFRRNSLSKLISLPSILIIGSKLAGKTSLIKTITKNDISIHPFANYLQLAYLKNENQIVQFIEGPSFAKEKINIIKKLKKLNLKSIIYLFDVSKNSDTIENQLENFEDIRNFFSGASFLIVANKIDTVEKNKVEKLKNRFKKIYEISLADTGQSKLENVLLKKELEDLNQLIHDINYEIEGGKEKQMIYKQQL